MFGLKGPSIHSGFRTFGYHGVDTVPRKKKTGPASHEDNAEKKDMRGETFSYFKELFQTSNIIAISLEY